MQQHMNGDAPHQDAATAVSHFHTHSVPLDMEDIRRDWDKPITDAGIAAKASVIVRVGMLDLGAGSGPMDHAFDLKPEYRQEAQA